MTSLTCVRVLTTTALSVGGWVGGKLTHSNCVEGGGVGGRRNLEKSWAREHASYHYQRLHNIVRPLIGEDVKITLFTSRPMPLYTPAIALVSCNRTVPHHNPLPVCVCVRERETKSCEM